MMATKHAFQCSGDHEDGFCIPYAPGEKSPYKPLTLHPANSLPFVAMPREIREFLAHYMERKDITNWWKLRQDEFDGDVPCQVYDNDRERFWDCFDETQYLLEENA